MKILLVNKFHYLRGGSEKYYFELGNLLKENGNEVAYFSMKDEKNISTGNKEYFVEPIDLNNGSKLKALDIIYSKANYKKMCEAIDDFKPDIIHLNNFQRQLSASVVKAAEDKNVPMVFTAHDIQAICPAISMLDSNGNICNECLKGKYKNCIKKSCVHNSKAKSILGAIENQYYKKHKVYSEKIFHIITPSEFYKTEFIKDGIDKEKITAIHNYIELEDYNMKTEDDNYILYFGRLAKEKGILYLLNAVSKAKKEINDIKLYIAGTGPEEKKIKEIIKRNKLEQNVELLGFLNHNKVKEYVSKSSIVVVPSIWYENCPYSVLETQAIGKPIIGSNLGGIPELVKDNENGMIYKYNDTDELANKILELYKNDELKKKFSKNAKEYAKNEYNKENYYKEIMNIYKGVVKK